MPTITVSQSPQPDPYASSLGYIGWNYPLPEAGSATAVTQGTGHAMGLELAGGTTANNVALGLSVPAVGTVPTSFKVGVTDGATMLAVSGELNASAILTGAVGPIALPLGAPWVVPKRGLYYVVVLQVGAFGTTQPSFYRNSNVNAQGGGISGGPRLNGAIGSGLGAMPAAGAAVAVTALGGLNFFAGLT